jgi:hypothetical protein
MDGLGRVFQVIPTADTIDIDLRDADAVTFVCVGNEAYTLQEHTAGGVAGQNLEVIDHYYQGQNTGVDTWTAKTQTAGETVDPNDGTDDTVVFTVHASQLSDGYSHVSVTAASSGLVTAILHDLRVARAAENLPIPGTAGA